MLRVWQAKATVTSRWVCKATGIRRFLIFWIDRKMPAAGRRGILAVMVFSEDRIGLDPRLSTFMEVVRAFQRCKRRRILQDLHVFKEVGLIHCFSDIVVDQFF